MKGIWLFLMTNFFIIKNGEVLSHGNRDEETKLYMVNITDTENVRQPELNVKHMHYLGGIQNFSNNAYVLLFLSDIDVRTSY